MLSPLAGFNIAFFLVPIVVMGVLSLFSAPARRGVPFIPVWTLGNYAHLLTQEFYIELMEFTFIFASVTTLLTLVIAYIPAYIMANEPNPRKKGFLIGLALIPMWGNYLVQVYGWVVVLGKEGMVNTILMRLGVISEPLQILYSFSAIVWGQVFVMVLPYAILSLVSVMHGIPREMYEAAISLGASRLRVIREVVWPLSVPGVVVASLFSFIWTVSAFAVPLIMGGAGQRTLSTEAYRQMTFNLNFPFSAAIAMTVFVLSMIPVVLLQRHIRRVGI
jgi:ABC-type spermidine/putrescine transport system permease subunit I